MLNKLNQKIMIKFILSLLKMNKYVIALIVIVVISLFGTVLSLKQQKAKLSKQVNKYVNNEYAYQKDLEGYQDSLSTERGVYKLTVTELQESNDKVIQELEEVRKEIKIKDKKIKEMSHFIASFKRDTTINITNIINEECEFEVDIKYNEETKIFISNTKKEREYFLYVQPNISSSFNAYIYEDKVWKEPNFWKRLFKFKWGKYTIDKSKLVPSNDLLEIKNFKVIRIEE